jgi:hypothetical protein
MLSIIVLDIELYSASTILAMAKFNSTKYKAEQSNHSANSLKMKTKNK